MKCRRCGDVIHECQHCGHSFRKSEVNICEPCREIMDETNKLEFAPANPNKYPIGTVLKWCLDCNNVKIVGTEIVDNKDECASCIDELKKLYDSF
ncbi:hypothetical protein PV-S19_0435 [Pacmanvirus S19]|nr:hypothetical protein PV-S19_0435 [Pacmanvirus S19]